MIERKDLAERLTNLANYYRSCHNLAVSRYDTATASEMRRKFNRLSMLVYKGNGRVIDSNGISTVLL